MVLFYLNHPTIQPFNYKTIKPFNHKTMINRMKFFLTLLMFFVSYIVQAQDKEVLKTFNKQIEAFNQGDVQALTENVHQDFKWYYISSDTLMLEVSGKENFRKSMESYFQSIPSVQSEIESYTIDGNKISFREIARWKSKSGEKSQSAMGIYEIRENKIYRAWYFL
jgi:hypothetical protein